MTQCNSGKRSAPNAAITKALAGLILSLLAASSFAGGEDVVASRVRHPRPGAADQADDQKTPPRHGKTEGLAKPPSGTRPNPEESNPALVNPCHGNPQPKWCGE